MYYLTSIADAIDKFVILILSKIVANDIKICSPFDTYISTYNSGWEITMLRFRDRV